MPFQYITVIVNSVDLGYNNFQNTTNWSKTGFIGYQTDRFILHLKLRLKQTNVRNVIKIDKEIGGVTILLSKNIHLIFCSYKIISIFICKAIL